MKVRSNGSSLDSLLEYSLCCIARESGTGVGYHSSKEGWPLACRRANAGFRLILPRAGRPLS
jgi:hypothetical protein